MRNIWNIIFCCAVSWLILSLVSCGPNPEESARKLETEIRTAVINEIPALTSLTCIFRITYTHYQGSLIFSDDIYLQQDEATLDYGYHIDEKNIKVVFEDGRKVLRVRLGRGEWLGTNRKTLKREKTHESYSSAADIDAAINQELESLKGKYGERALKEASQNIENFFRVVAAQYGLKLDFMLE